MTYKHIITLIAALVPLFSSAQDASQYADSVQHTVSIRENSQQSFPLTVPAGNYSGITYLGDNRYAVVSDKSATDGFFIFDIQLDSLSGSIISVTNQGFKSSATANRDQEGIAYVPSTNTIYISGEQDNRILEYSLDGKHTGRQLSIPEVFSTATPNYGFESLTYNPRTHLFWTTTESTLPPDGTQASPSNSVVNHLRLQSFNDSLQPVSQYLYDMDVPTAHSSSSNYAMGVSELCAMDDGRIIVLEREFYVSRAKLGSFVNCKLYIVSPAASAPNTLLPKTQLLQFKTNLSLFNYSIANYEGMCLGPRLSDGSQVLVMVSDSQNQYKGVLYDWFKTIVIK